MLDDRPVGIYVHVPFCGQRCAYCDFAIIAGQDRRIPEFFRALAGEIAARAQRSPDRAARSVYFGGGTPSRVPPAAIARTIETIRRAFHLDPLAEVSLEANPEDVTDEHLDGWLEAGVNRLTIGIQSIEESGLASLGRPGSARESFAAVIAARRAGVPSLGIDLIFGWPGQGLAGWLAELDRVLACSPDHVSIYALETTSRTPLVREIERGRRPPPDPDLMADMYEAAVPRLEQAGVRRYEISNFARPGHASRHNLLYWTDQPYIGFGPSAASYLDGARWTNPRRFSDYLEAAAHGCPPVPEESFDPHRRAGEAIVFGLRTISGIDLTVIAARYGESAVAERGPVLARAEAAGLAIREGSRIRLSARGFLIADELFVDLL